MVTPDPADPTTNIPPYRPSELALSRWWNGADLSAPLLTVDGSLVSIVYRGRWSHGLGPDFREAMIDFGDGRLETGSIELHLDAAAWREHGHHLDKRYNDVVMHAVLEHRSGETRRSDGKIVPIALLRPDSVELQALETQHVDWSRVGGTVCAEQVARRDPTPIRAILWEFGDRRLAGKAARIESQFADEPPAEVLHQLLFDGLGYSANREPMRQLSRLLPLHSLEPLLGTVGPEVRWATALGLLAGAAGFLPFSPSEAHLAALTPEDVSAAESAWDRLGGAWHQHHLPATVWDRARVRPANHPLLRLSHAAALVANSPEGISSHLLATLRAGDDVVETLIGCSAWQDRSPLGRGRAVALVANGLIPFALALGGHTEDQELSERASSEWERLEPADSNATTRRARRQVAGQSRVPGLGERGQQGLIHLDGHFCRPRRCMECAIASLALLGDFAEEDAEVRIDAAVLAPG